MIDPAALKAEHSRGYITNRFTGKETPGSCETCVPLRPFPCAAWLAADAIEVALDQPCPQGVHACCCDGMPQRIDGGSEMKRWWRRHRFLLAYRILRNEVERHRAAGHDVEFVAVNESRISVECKDCPDPQP